MRQAAIQLHTEAGVILSGPWGSISFSKFQTALKANQLYVWSPTSPPGRPILIFKGPDGGQPIHLLATDREEGEDSQEEEEAGGRSWKPGQGRWGHYDVISG